MLRLQWSSLISLLEDENYQKSNFVEKNDLILRKRDGHSRRERIKIIDLHERRAHFCWMIVIENRNQFHKYWLFSAKRHVKRHVTCQKHQFYFELSRDPLFESVCKAIFSHHLYLKNEEVYTPQTCCLMGTSVLNKNTWIRQLCNHKLRDFAPAFGCENFTGLQKRSPRTLKSSHLCL